MMIEESKEAKRRKGVIYGVGGAIQTRCNTDNCNATIAGSYQPRTDQTVAHAAARTAARHVC